MPRDQFEARSREILNIPLSVLFGRGTAEKDRVDPKIYEEIMRTFNKMRPPVTRSQEIGAFLFLFRESSKKKVLILEGGQDPKNGLAMALVATIFPIPDPELIYEGLKDYFRTRHMRTGSMSREAADALFAKLESAAGGTPLRHNIISTKQLKQMIKEAKEEHKRKQEQTESK